jgi:NAD(P)-dependent dehydrogenase (short-subunit alcohol dehydrogenase family)
MRLVLVGAPGTIGTAVCQLLREQHEILAVGHRQGDHTVDIKDRNSIAKLFERIGLFDGLVCTAGNVHFGDFAQIGDREMRIGLDDKLMGQVNQVLIGRQYLNDNGSFTLTSGILSHDPIRYGTAASLVNGAIDAFVRAAAVELTPGMRINAISPSVVTESLPAYGKFFRGHESVPLARVANAYLKSIEGLLTGKVIKVV